MKKLLCAVLMLLCMMGCAAAEEAAGAQIVLKENLSTGYSWQWRIESAGGLVEVESRYVLDADPADDRDPLPPGTGGRREIVLIGREPGEAVITFTYQRAWEEKAPLYTLVYTVCAEEDGTVTILRCDFAW